VLEHVIPDGDPGFPTCLAMYGIAEDAIGYLSEELARCPVFTP
jgi:hypothetical protein